MNAEKKQQLIELCDVLEKAGCDMNVGNRRFAVLRPEDKPVLGIVFPSRKDRDVARPEMQMAEYILLGLARDFATQAHIETFGIEPELPVPIWLDEGESEPELMWQHKHVLFDSEIAALIAALKSLGVAEAFPGP